MTQLSPISSGFMSPARPGQGKCVVKPEASACTAPCATGANASLSQRPVLTSIASAATKTTLGEIQQWAANIWAWKNEAHRWSTIP